MHESFCIFALKYIKWKLLKSQEKLTETRKWKFNPFLFIIHRPNSQKCKNIIIIKDVDLISTY